MKKKGFKMCNIFKFIFLKILVKYFLYIFYSKMLS